MNPSDKRVAWIVGLIAAVLVLCCIVTLCLAVALASFGLSQRRAGDIFRNFPGIPLVPPLQEDREQILPEPPTSPALPGEIRGALVQQVIPDSPADEVDIRPGDIITAVDDETLTPQRSLAQLIGQYAPGDTVTITLTRLVGARRGQFDVQVELDENPDVPGKPYLGVTYTDLFMEQP